MRCSFGDGDALWDSLFPSLMGFPNDRKRQRGHHMAGRAVSQWVGSWAQHLGAPMVLRGLCWLRSSAGSVNSASVLCVCRRQLGRKEVGHGGQAGPSQWRQWEAPLLSGSICLQICWAEGNQTAHPRKVVLTVCAGDPRLLPMPAGLAPDGGHVTLDEALRTLVPHQRVDLVAFLLPPEGPGMLYHGGLSTGHWEAGSCVSGPQGSWAMIHPSCDRSAWGPGPLHHHPSLAASR